MSLYSYRSTGYVTKWDADGNVEASYQVSDEACTCPAGHRQTCRHRQMLKDLLPIADTHWFWDYNRLMPVDIHGTPKSTIDALIVPVIDPDEAEIIEPMSRMGNGTPHLGGVYAKDVTPVIDHQAEQDTSPNIGTTFCSTFDVARRAARAEQDIPPTIATTPPEVAKWRRI